MDVNAFTMPWKPQHRTETQNLGWTVHDMRFEYSSKEMIAEIPTLDK